MSDQFSKSLLDHICDYEDQLKTVFYLSVAVLLPSLLSLMGIDSGTATYVVTVLNIAGLSVLAVVTGFFVFQCR